MDKWTAQDEAKLQALEARKERLYVAHTRRLYDLIKKRVPVASGKTNCASFLDFHDAMVRHASEFRQALEPLYTGDMDDE